MFLPVKVKNIIFNLKTHTMEKFKVNLSSIETDSQSNSITFFVSSDFENTLNKLVNVVKFEPYKDDTKDSKYPTVTCFLLDDGEKLTFKFREDVSFDFIHFTLNPFSLFLQDSKSKEKKLIKTFTRTIITTP